jgi:hypothetical protein
MAYPPYRPQPKPGPVPKLAPGEEPSLEELMAELLRNEREQAASDATQGLLGRIRQQRRAIRDDETGP